MKKILSTMVLGSVLATVASADIARVEAGVGVWSYKPSGFISYTDYDGTLAHTSLEKNQVSAYAWLLIKHPIPIIPNLRVEYASVHDDGQTTGSYDGISAKKGTVSTLDLTQYDIIPYYNILDNTFWTTIDIGVDVKIINSDYTAKGVSLLGGLLTTEDYNKKATIPVPLGYIRGRVEIPTTNIGLETDAKYISYGGNTVYDIRAKVDYTLGFIPVVQPAIEIGYRAQKYDIQSEDKKTKVKMDFGGVYMGVMVRF